MSSTRLGVVAVLLLFVATGCSKNNPVAPNAIRENGKVCLTVNKSGNPADNIVSGSVTIVKGALEKTQTFTFAGQMGSVVFENIQVGNWRVEVKLFDADGMELYHGDGSAVVTRGNTTLLKITVNANTGNLQVVVEVPGDTTTAANLVLWNTLNGGPESMVGPSFRVHGSPSYVAGKFGLGALVTPGNYFTLPADQAAQVVKPAAGTMEMWFIPNWNSSEMANQTIGLFDSAANDSGDRFMVCFFFSGDTFSVTAFNVEPANVPRTSVENYFQTGVPVHIAVVWNAQGIDGTTDTVRTYLNNDLVLHSSIPIKLNPRAADLLIGQHVWSGVSANGVFDNVKFWDREKLDFSDREIE